MVTLPPVPALIVGEVTHARMGPHAHAFRYRHYQWLVDLDAVPAWKGWGWLARFQPTDHLSSPPDFPALKANVLRILGRAGIEVSTARRVLMLAHARSFGHAFDPMSAFWVFDEQDQCLGVVVEVHNTYGGRHAYAVVPDADGSAEVTKDFYVSPFNDASGSYGLQFSMEVDRVSVGIELWRSERPVVRATTAGRVVPATRWSLARVAASHPFMTLKVSALIRRHGIAMWLKRVPVQPREDAERAARNDASVA